MKEIHGATPELEVLFMGAAALGLPGKNDIDLDVLCPAQDVARNAERLSVVLGKPTSASPTITCWEFVRNGFEVDCILSDPTTSHVPRQQRVFELLKANAGLREAYEKIKRDSNGLPMTEYNKRKEGFFASILASNGLD